MTCAWPDPMDALLEAFGLFIYVRVTVVVTAEPTRDLSGG